MALVNKYPDYSCVPEVMPKSHSESLTMSPIAKVIFESEGSSYTITMGNESCPSENNTASLKSLEFGGSDGAAVEIVIVDEKGGEFQKFEQTIARNVCKGKIKMKFQYGWAYTDCAGNVNKDISGFIYCILFSYTVNFEPTGMVKYTLKGKDNMHIIFPSREDEVFGDDKNKMLLEEAIKKLGNKNDPKINFVFKRYVENGPAEDWHFKGHPDQPKSVWRSNGTNKLSIVKDWAKPYSTDKDRGFVQIYDWTKEDPTCTFWEDTKLCDGKRACSSKKTYIVNGGKDSNVISFAPTLEYIATFASKSTGGGPDATGGSKPKKQTDKNVKFKEECPWFSDATEEKIGLQTSSSSNPQTRDTEGQDKSQEKDMKGGKQKADAELGVNPSIRPPITADLKIKGDTSDCFMSPIKMKTTQISLVVINPQYLDSSSMTCDSWLAKPTVNDALSNKEWWVMEVQHSVSESTFVTTLKLKLQFVPKKKYGEDGYMPPPSCS